MKTLLCALVMLIAAPAPAAAQTATAGPAGTWKVVGPPWTIAITTAGQTLTGTVSDGAGFSAEIYDGKIEGNTVTFKARSADGDRTVTFTGTINGDEISFSRDVQVRQGGNPGGNNILGAAGPREFMAQRAGSVEMWSGTIRNAPTPRNATPNPNPRPVTLASKKVPAPHWRWRGGEKEIEVRTFSLPMGTFELNAFQLEGDRLTYSYSRPAAGDVVECQLTRAAAKFEGRCQATGGGFTVLIELIPPAPADGGQAAAAIKR
ncbi:MAG: hypothetical protein WD690_13780 [Vicinamibacterales bacterium]